MANQFGMVFQNAAEDFFETIIYATAYNEAYAQVKKLIDENVKDKLLREALEGASSVLIMGFAI